MLRRVFSSCSSSHTQLYFSGIQPTGVPHLGNYFGFIEPWLNLQESLPSSTQMMLSVVDQHAISVGPKPAAVLRQDIRRMAAGLLACGVCPQRTLLFRQSDVPQISQLTWILGALQTVPKLQRLPQYKDKAQRYPKGEIPVGLLIYPLLQAADVLMFKATHVPVGADQSQHLNLLTDLAINFNAKYESHLFPVPMQVTREISARVRSLREPAKKMSKSDASPRSRIDIIDTRDAIFEKCKKAVSDSEPLISYEPERRQAVSNLIDLYVAVSGSAIEDVLSTKWNTSDLKNNLAEKVDIKLAPIRQKFHELEKSNEVDDILHENGKKALKIAERNLEEIRQTIGFL